MSRLRRRELIPEDTQVVATVEGPKIVHGRFGRQVAADINVIDGDFKGVRFPDWFSFGKDDKSEEEYIPYGAGLYSLLAMKAPEIDEVLDDEALTEAAYQKWLKKVVAGLDGTRISARVGIKAPKNAPEKKRNFLQPGTFGLHEDEGEDFAELDMS